MNTVVEILQKQIDRLIEERNSMKMELDREREISANLRQESTNWRLAHEQTKAAAEKFARSVEILMKYR